MRDGLLSGRAGDRQEIATFHGKSLEGAVRSDARVLGHLTDLYLCDKCGFKSSVGDTSRMSGPARRRSWTISVVVDRVKSYATCCECIARWEIEIAGRLRSDLTST